MYLRDGLYTETIVCIAYIDGLPVHQADAESEQFGVYVGKVGDIIRILASRTALHLVVGFLGNLLYL